MKPLRLYANLRFADAQGSKELLRAILEEVQDDSIDIVGNQMTINVSLNQLSKETKSALLGAEEIIELHFGKAKFEVTTEIPTDSESAKGAVTEEATEAAGQFYEPENTAKEPDNQNDEEEQQGDQESKEPSVKEVKETDVLKSKLDELANVSDTYDDFIRRVALWCKLNSKVEIFSKLVHAADKITTEVTWKKLTNVLNEQGIEITTSERNYCTTLVRRHFDSFNIATNIIGLINEMQSYREELEKATNPEKANSADKTGTTGTDGFASEEVTETETCASVNAEGVTANADEPVTEGTTPADTETPKTRFECIPMDECLKETLLNIDKADVKTYVILSAMGIEYSKYDHGRQQMYELTEAAVYNPGHDLNKIMVELRQWLPDQNLSAVMELATFINDYAKKNGAKDLVKTETFIEELREIVLMSEAKNRN